MQRILYVLALAFFAAPSWGQDDPPPQPTPSLTIEGPSEGKVNSFIDFDATGAPAKATYRWILLPLDTKAQVRPVGPKMTIVGPPGSYTLILSVSDGTAEQMDLHTFTILGDGPPPPPPVVTPLKQLAGDAAAPLGQLYSNLLIALGKGLFEDVAHFHATEAASLRDANLTGHGATAEISKRLNLATLEELKGPIQKIVDELGTLPPVVEGKRHVVILHETADDTAEQARMFTQLRNGPNADYLKTKGHKLDILDDDSVDGSGQPVKIVSQLKALGVAMPALFVLDEADNVIHSRSLPATASQVLEVVKAHGG